ncbi:malonyl-coenzyme:anthocyanin 5-O-glucoside-6'''-O-malonyltransferase-like [Salvia hispanica]|uniref:malonyl-coenzyme:anthocyanin 5-O-glucoside-6'''-O-malonyltransferase-like n=1 Tax=Salvia hispanica TaxID=49212 RepID=UPI0020091C29|nr:malonyl-coenzyme:anthocyanin 5-O-glucoside-6'''-O-malonyltransferase-like [Salvia hispanica]
MTTVLETCRIPPAPGAAAELSLPLSYLDVTWIHFTPIRRLIFYSHPCSEAEFSNTIVPNLKHSLSLTLKHYLPVAGNLLYPSDTAQKPAIRYLAGDSVPLTVAVSANDFDHLTANHSRDADQFYDYIPLIPSMTIDRDEFKVVPVFALQATLFPGRGVAVGFTNHHVLGDASSIVGFIKAWAEINRLGSESVSVENRPVFDRGLINDPCGWDHLNWEVMREIPFTPPPSSDPVPTGRVRATFTLDRTGLEKLKKRTGPVQISSFVAAASYVWSCLAKSGRAGDVAEHFSFVIDVRGRADPPVPASYFGNCLSYAVARVEAGRLAGEEGFAAAAEEFGRVMRERVNRKEEVLRCMQNWRESFEEMKGIRAVGVSGSPKFDLGAADFGWGEARKVEVLSIDGESSMSLSKSRGEGGGLEVGLSMEKKRMEAFAAIFAQGLM